MTKGKKRVPIFLITVLLLIALVIAVFTAAGGREGVKRILNRLRYAPAPQVGEEAIQEAFLELSQKNPEAADYISAYKGITDYDLELDLSGELTAGEIPYLVQWDGRWGYCLYGSGLIGWTGCGPTALSMVAMGLTGNGKLTPAYIADFAIREGYCVPGNGTAWLLFSQGAEKLGLHAKEIPLWEASMRQELEAGRPIICIMRKGHFTETGHYIVLTGCDSEGFQVYDPFRPSNCKTWAYDTIKDEISNIWSYST